MHYAFPADVQKLIADQLASGQYADEDDVLRNALQTLRDAADDVGAVQAAIDEWQSGDQGLPLDEAFDQVKADLTS